MNLKLSIIIPFYGTADSQLLQQCLKSIHSQNLDETEYEIIIADDSDNGPGAGAARNNGIRQAKGEYLFFVDADDYLFPDTLSACMLLLETERPEVLSFGFSNVYERSTTFHKHKQKQNSHRIYLSGSAFMLLHNFTGTVWRHLISKKTLIQHQLFFTEKIYHEDEEFLAKLYFHAAKVIITDWPVYAYYQHPHSIMHHLDKKQQMKRVSDFRQVLSQLQSYLYSQSQVSVLQQEALERRIHFLTIDYIIQLLRNRCPNGSILKEINELKKSRFLPLPKMRYSWKYSLFRVVINQIIRL